MNNKPKTCSLEVSQKITELGIKLETYFSHVLNKPDIGIDPLMVTRCCVGLNHISAPQAGELGEVLPYRTKSFNTKCMGWWCHTQDCDDPLPIHTLLEIDTEANARGLMLCWLVENGHVTLEEINR